MFGEGKGGYPIADDEMIEHANIHQGQRLSQGASNLLVGLARFAARVAGR